jgi:dimethylhistidine N-methyltransferase
MSEIHFIDLNPPKDHFQEDVLYGLSQTPKVLYPKYLYDQKGSQLFDAICALDEYYPTRTEISILEDNSETIDELLPAKTALIEFGSGSSVKIRKLLDQSLKIKSYVPIDISKEHLLEAAEKINRAYPHLPVTAICADYTVMDQFPADSHTDHLSRAVFFPGSTIGNLDKDEALALLRNTHKWLGPKGRLIIGFDLIKDRERLIKAYDDAKGVTRAFNLNILERINRELDGNFDLSSFDHRAIFSEEEESVQMHLVALRPQAVTIAGQSFEFAEGETIHTESSRKQRLDRFKLMAQNAGFAIEKAFTDPAGDFAVCVLKAE